MLTRFKTKKVNTSITVGECLKNKREKKELSIKDVSEKLKIKLNYLENLEENNYEKLPPDVYVKGFIKSYALLVGFDAEKMINLYSKEKVINDRIKNRNRFKKEGLSKNKFSISNYISITPKIITVFFSLFILFVVVYYLWHQINSFNSMPYLFISQPAIDQISDKPEIEVIGQTEKEAKVKINGQDIFVDSNGHFQEKVFLKPGNNVLSIKTINRFNKTTMQLRNIIYKKRPEPIPEQIDFRKNNINGIISDEEIEFIGP